MLSLTITHQRLLTAGLWLNWKLEVESSLGRGFSNCNHDSGFKIIISPVVVCSQFAVRVSFDGTTNYTLELPPFVRACDIGTFGVWCRYAQSLFTSIEIPVDLFVSMMCSTRL